MPMKRQNGPSDQAASGRMSLGGAVVKALSTTTFCSICAAMKMYLAVTRTHGSAWRRVCG
jgi:hypothetical protein